MDHRPRLLQDIQTSTGADPPDSQHNKHPHLNPRQDHRRLRLPLKEGRTSKYTPRGDILCLFPFSFVSATGIIFFLLRITICSKTQPKFTCSTIHTHTHTHVVSFLFFSLATHSEEKIIKEHALFSCTKNIPTVTFEKLHGWDRHFANGTDVPNRRRFTGGLNPEQCRCQNKWVHVVAN